MGLGLLELLLILLVLIGLVAAVAVTSVRRARLRSSAPPDAEVVREWRLVQATRVLGVVLGIFVAAQVSQQGGYGVGAMLAPAAFGLCVVLATALGETVVRPRRPTGTRTASLTPRRLVHYLPRATAVLVGLMVLISAVALVFTTLTASRDDHTGEIRAISCVGPGVASSHTPYPGSYYSLPLALLLLAVLAVASLAARQVIRRPRGMATTDAGDDSLRRRSVDVIVAATGIAFCAPYFGVALTAGSALHGLAGSSPSGAPSWADSIGQVLLFSAPVAFFLAAWCALQLLLGGVGSTPRPRLPAEAPADR